MQAAGQRQPHTVSQVSTQDPTPITASPQPLGRSFWNKNMGEQGVWEHRDSYIKEVEAQGSPQLMLSQLSAGGKRGTAVS